LQLRAVARPDDCCKPSTRALRAHAQQRWPRSVVQLPSPHTHAHRHHAPTCADRRIDNTSSAGAAASHGGLLQALQHWSRGQWRRGAGALERWLARSPKDLFALRLCQDAYLFMGDTVNLRDVVTRVFPAWGHGDYGYGAVLAMYAFG
jgi:hypothetical protein